MQRAMVPTMIAVVAGSSNMLPARECPSSPAHPHAQTFVVVTAFATCDKVLQEIEARIQANSDGSWLDPHNGGHYFLDSVQGVSHLDAHRDTGSASIAQGGPFRDNLRFTFFQEGANCTIAACSASQVVSVTDFSGGYCNLRNLYCNSNVGCTTQKHDFLFKEGYIGLSPGNGQYPGASADTSMCIVPVAVSVEAHVSSTCQEEGTEVSSHNEGLAKCCSGKSRTNNRCRNGKCEDHRYCCYYCPGDTDMNSTMV